MGRAGLVNGPAGEAAWVYGGQLWESPTLSPTEDGPGTPAGSTILMRAHQSWPSGFLSSDAWGWRSVGVEVVADTPLRVEKAHVCVYFGLIHTGPSSDSLSR